MTEELSPKKAAVLSALHHRGMAADAALRIIGGLHDERERQLLGDLIQWFLNSPWDDRVAVRYVAALAENWAQKNELEQRSRKGAEARAKLFEQKSTDRPD